VPLLHELPAPFDDLVLVAFSVQQEPLEVVGVVAPALFLVKGQ
jgi:hypothetical protein